MTGAGSGIGRASAEALAEAGFTLVLAGRRREQLEAAVAEIGPDDAVAVTCDVRDPASIEALFGEIETASGGSTCCSTTPGSVPLPCSSTS